MGGVEEAACLWFRFLLFGLVCQSHDHHSHNHHCHCHIAHCHPLHSSTLRPTPRYNQGGQGALVSLSPSSSSGKLHDIWKFHVFHANPQQQQQSAHVPSNAIRAAAACSGGHIFAIKSLPHRQLFIDQAEASVATLIIFVIISGRSLSSSKSTSVSA